MSVAAENSRDEALGVGLFGGGSVGEQRVLGWEECERARVRAARVRPALRLRRWMG